MKHFKKLDLYKTEITATKLKVARNHPAGGNEPAVDEGDTVTDTQPSFNIAIEKTTWLRGETVVFTGIGTPQKPVHANSRSRAEFW